MGIAERKEKEKLERRMSILEAAKIIFHAKGLSGTTMDEIAERAELSKGTLYLYFKSKEELYLSLLDEGDQIFHKMIRNELLPSLSAEQMVRKTATVYHEFYLKYPEYFNIMFLLHHGDLQDKVSSELYEQCMCRAADSLSMIEGIFQKGIGEGTFRDIDTWTMTLALWATANGIFLINKNKEHHEFMRGIDEKTLLDTAVDIYLEGLKKKL